MRLLSLPLARFGLHPNSAYVRTTYAYVLVYHGEPDKALERTKGGPQTEPP